MKSELQDHNRSINVKRSEKDRIHDEVLRGSQSSACSEIVEVHVILTTQPATSFAIND